MKKITTLLISLLASFNLIAVPVLVRAETNSTETTTAETNEEKDEDKAETTEEKKSRNQRVEEYKKSLKEKLTEATKTRTAERCEGAQNKAKTRHEKDTTALKGRTTAYSKITAALERTAARLKEKSIDVSTLESNLATLKTKIDNFNTLESTSRQALEDLTKLDCKSDTEAFKAALEAARLARQNAQAAAKEVRTYLNDVVKETLKTLKAEADRQSTED